MILSLFEVYRRRDDNRTMAVAVSASIVVHMLLLWQSAAIVQRPSPDAEKLGEPRGPIVVQIVPAPSARPAEPVPVPRAEPRRPAPPRAAPRSPSPPRTAAPAPSPAPPVIARADPTPGTPAVPAPRADSPPPARAPSGEDLSSYIESRRRNRVDASPALPFPDAKPQPQTQPTEDAGSRANRLAAANLATGRTQQAFGYDPNRGGGVFSIRHVALDYAEFMFYGWNKEARRNTAQLIEVRKGSNPDIRTAIVRRMIAIIREHERGDFMWESPRLGRYVKLSARPQDNAGLEEFMMEEFFDDARRAR